MRIATLTAAVSMATLLLALGASTAAALRSIEVSVFQDNSSTRALTFEGGGSRVICEVTLTIEFLTWIEKRAGSLAGWANARFNEAGCRAGRARPLNTLEGWRVTYVSFTGTLPRIESVRFQINGMAFLVSAFGGFGECLFRGNAQFTTVGSGGIALQADERVTLPLSRNLNGLFCPETGNFRGTLGFERALIPRLV